MNVISQIVSQELIEAIGWTLIHSLWQAAAVAIGFALLTVFMRRYSSRTRYFIGVTALALILAMSIGTFVSIYKSYTPGGEGMLLEPSTSASVSGSAGAALEGNTVSSAGIPAFFETYFRRHLPLVVTIWMLGVLVLMLRLSGGFLYNQRIKVHRTQSLPRSWQNRFNKLCRETKLAGTVRVVQSALVKIPQTVGYFKPVILFPIGMFTGMPQEQVEALLAHELAHIARRDYLINLFQEFVEVLFFYHPAVRWISNFVRVEREHCCDDIAVSVSGNPVDYARALTSVQEQVMQQGLGLQPAGAAVAVTGKSRSLVNRIKRLVTPNIRRRSEFSGGFLGTAFLVFCIFTLVAGANAATTFDHPEKVIPPTIVQVSETPDTPEIVEPVEPAQEIPQTQEEKEKKKKEELEKKLEEEELIKQEAELAEEREEMEEELEKEEKEMAREQAVLAEQEKELRIIQEKELAKIKAELRKQKEEMALRMKERNEKVKSEYKEFVKQQKEEMVRQQELLKQEKLEMTEQREQLKKLREEQRIKIHEELKVRKKEMAEQRVRLRKEIKEKHLKKVKEMKAKVAKMKKEKATFMNSIRKQLLHDKLIDDSNEFNFKLTDNALYINGKKFTGEILKKYKEIFKKQSGKDLEEDDTFTINMER